MESRGRVMDRRFSVGWTLGGAEMCRVQVQVHIFCSVVNWGVIVGCHHCCVTDMYLEMVVFHKYINAHDI